MSGVCWVYWEQPVPPTRIAMHHGNPCSRHLLSYTKDPWLHAVPDSGTWDSGGALEHIGVCSGSEVPLARYFRQKTR